MLDIVFLVGLLIFAMSSVYFYFAGKDKNGLNTAFLVSFVTLISYVLMWQGSLTVVTQAGEPILWTRWLFYGLSCTLLMVTGMLAARDLTVVRWAYFAISAVAYVLLVIKVLSVKTAKSRWVHNYIFFGWTVFPIVFVLAPTGLGLIGAAVANLLYLLLDIYTKIIFNIQLGRAS